MKKSVFSLITLAIASVTVFTSCDSENDGFGSNNTKHYESSYNNSSSSDSNSNSNSQSNTESKQKDVKYTSTESTLVLKDGAPEGAGLQLANVMKNFLQQQVGKYGQVEASYENDKVVISINSSSDDELAVRLNVSNAASCKSEYCSAIQKLGYVKEFNLKLLNHDFTYKLTNNYKGTWECTDSKGNKYTLVCNESTEGYDDAKSYKNVIMTINGEPMATYISSNGIVATSETKTNNIGKLVDQFFNRIYCFEVKSFDGKTMVVKISTISETLQSDATFVKVSE